MSRVSGRWGLWASVLGLALVAGAGHSGPVAPEQLPEPVARTFQAMFPNGTIEKLTGEVENGVMVYDFEFRAGGREKEADIAADGTMLESTLVIVAKDIPAPALKRIRSAARGAKLGRLEWIETRYELKEGKVIPLPAPVIKYAAEMARRNLRAEIIVTPTGTVLEQPEWLPAPDATAPPPGRTGS